MMEICYRKIFQKEAGKTKKQIVHFFIKNSFIMKFSQFSLLIFLLSSIQINAQEYGSEIKDADGNTYQTIKINDLYWTASNLHTTKGYKPDGTLVEINQLTIGNPDISTPGMYWHENNPDSKNSSIYGPVYNWKAISNGGTCNICPKGWRIPTLDEWQKVIRKWYGVDGVPSGAPGLVYAAKQLRAQGADHWPANNAGTATNSTGFSALPGGWIWNTRLSFSYLGKRSAWWAPNGNTPNFLKIADGENGAWLGLASYYDNLYVRCVRAASEVESENNFLEGVSAESKEQINTFFETYGGRDAFTEHYRDAIQAFINTEDQVKAGNYVQAKAILDQFWKKYPAGTQVWGERFLSSTPHSTFAGGPVAYNALRMITDVVNYHLNKSTNTVTPHTLNMKVVLVGKAKGVMPRNVTEMAQNQGVQMENELDIRLKAENNKVIKRLLSTFTRYVTAMTDGKLLVDVQVIDLPQLTIDAEVRKVGEGTKGHQARIKNSNLRPVWDVLSKEVKDDTDLWWIMYPSFTPGVGSKNQAVAKIENFADYGFITGGITVGPKGSPTMMCDDLFMIEKQPFLSANGGMFTDVEQRCYAPQWFQHEFYHHLYGLFPSFPQEPRGFEPTGHDWQTRSFWPQDFVGINEADFYQESLHKRIKQETARPLHVRLRKRVESMPNSVLNQLTVQDVLGDYQAERPTNDHHYFTIVEENGGYRWKNRAGLDMEVEIRPQDGELRLVLYNQLWKIILSKDYETEQYTPKVIGIRPTDGGALILKK